jgi:hypothetical protein
MKIIIDYESRWCNSFLARSNNEPAPKNGRKFIASIAELKKPNTNNYISHLDLTKDTIMGILCRLIGDQRKLYQSLTASDYYFKDFKKEDITFDDIVAKRIVSNEVVFLRNLTGSTDQNSFTGMINTNHPVFTSNYSAEFWGVLALTFDELVDFIINDNYKIDSEIDLDPLTIKATFESFKGNKKCDNKAKQAADILQNKFEKFKPFDAKGNLKTSPMYCSALYLQLERLEQKFDMTTAKSKSGGITGVSKNGFTAKDFMDNYTTGKKKPIYGNPYIKTEYIKGQGKVNKMLQKASGKLIINLNINQDKARELKQLIENAGVSAFPLGKKGLAYVSKIKL